MDPEQFLDDLVSGLLGDDDEDDGEPGGSEPIGNAPFGGNEPVGSDPLSGDSNDTVTAPIVPQADGSEVQNLPASIVSGQAANALSAALSAAGGDPFGYGQSLEGFGAGLPESQRFGDASRNWRTGPDIEPYLAMVTGNREGLNEQQQRTYDAVSDNRVASRGGPTFGGLLGGLRGAIEGAVNRQDVQEGFERSGNTRLLQPGSRGADVNWSQWAKEAAEGQPRVYPQMTPEGLARVRSEGGKFESEAVSGGAMGLTPIRFGNGQEGWLDKQTNRFYNRAGDRVGTEVSASDAMRKPAAPVQRTSGAGPTGPTGGGGGQPDLAYLGSPEASAIRLGTRDAPRDTERFYRADRWYGAGAGPVERRADGKPVSIGSGQQVTPPAGSRVIQEGEWTYVIGADGKTVMYRNGQKVG